MPKLKLKKPIPFSFVLDELDAELPSLRRIRMFETAEKTKTTWNNLPESSPTFEEEVLKVCALIRKRDPRLGKTPDRKKPRRKSESTVSESRSRPRRRARREARR